MRIRRRAQYFPLFMTIIVVLFGFMVTIYNVLGMQSNAAVAMETAIRSAAYAALQQTGTGSEAESGRWLMDGAKATTTARAILVDSIVGASEAANTGSSAGLFSGSLEPLLLDSTSTGEEDSGTAGGTVHGADVEVLDPAQQIGQTSSRWYNGFESLSDDILCEVSTYPQTVRSTLLGTCFDRPAVVIRLRLPARQLSGEIVTITRVGYQQVGTDVRSSVTP